MTCVCAKLVSAAHTNRFIGFVSRTKPMHQVLGLKCKCHLLFWNVGGVGSYQVMNKVSLKEYGFGFLDSLIVLKSLPTSYWKQVALCCMNRGWQRISILEILL